MCVVEFAALKGERNKIATTMCRFFAYKLCGEKVAIDVSFGRTVFCFGSFTLSTDFGLFSHRSFE